ncbi:valyl-tRNA synthetase modifier [Escherichia phage Ec_Makalu_001]|uniref:Valyl-tRNA synthetase modifier n=3 Tax=Krischvirus gec3s TaxID=2560444 RepID=A0A6B9SQK5_9CAUD|nr:valyl-tRNA synthetase modifier [Escherichia phage Ec_Makalu_002]QHJ73041.1 valyl-tRNA synthetase modifier [Escherichia phage Ec_Makalu_003]QHJ73312.1 valyl-tRNA synthetase modifier [Escherichia phage Ec_Makalu_001]
MKKLTVIAMIAMMLSAGALASNERPYPKFEYKGFEINKKIIKTFCDNDNMCSDFIALELDEAYKQGRDEKRKNRAWDLSIASFAKTKRNLCDTAPDKQLCFAYRDTLLSRFMAGLSSRD